MKFNDIEFDTYFKNYPDANGYFGKYGGSYIPPELQTAMNEINEAYQTICKSRKFISELRRIRKEFQGRPTPISHLARLSDKIGTGVQLYVKREDLNHTGAHKAERPYRSYRTVLQDGRWGLVCPETPCGCGEVR